jgi:alkylation response protein AidB-like acyl-CoA dehydrogenase
VNVFDFYQLMAQFAVSNSRQTEGSCLAIRRLARKLYKLINFGHELRSRAGGFEINWILVGPLIWMAFFAIQSSASGQESVVDSMPAMPWLMPQAAIDRLKSQHSNSNPSLVSQDELDQLIQDDGGGACPIAAGLIAQQTLRSMIGFPLDLHPHRTALRLFQENPELKEGRISNQRFVELLAFLCKDLDETPVAITAVSAPTSDYETTGTRWKPTDGPDLSVAAGQIKILAYTVTTATGTVRGRHFVLLQGGDGNQLSFVNPGKPTKDYTFIVEYRGDSSGPKRHVFFHSPAGLDKTNQTYELNTIFTIRLINKQPGVAEREDVSVHGIKEKIDQLATLLRQQGDLSNPTAWRQHGVAFGLPGLDLPTEVGGSGWSTVDMLEVFRHAGKHNLNLRDVVGAAHGRPLAKSNSAYAKRVLNDIVAGKAYVAVAITEPEAGSDMRAMESRATKVGNGFALSGQKLWNARLRQATHVVLYTLASNGKPGARTAFLLPIDHPGLQIVDEYAHGLTGNSFGGLKFNDMFVGPEYLLGEDGDGGKIFNEHFTYWRLMQSAAAIGCGEAALQQMADRIKDRKAYGGPIGRFTHLQQPIGEYTTKLQMAMALAREAAVLMDQGNYEAASPLVNGIKAEGVEIALVASDAAMRAHGAMGYSRQVDLGDRVRDLMGLRIADGTTDVMRMEVVRSVYGYSYWDMAVRSYKTEEQKSLGEK